MESNYDDVEVAIAPRLESLELWSKILGETTLGTFPWSHTLTVSGSGPYSDEIHLHLAMTVCPRPPTSGELSPSEGEDDYLWKQITFSRSFHRSVRWSEQEVHRALRDFVICVVNHEIDEGILIDGARPFDPHVTDPGLERRELHF